MRKIIIREPNHFNNLNIILTKTKRDEKTIILPHAEHYVNEFSQC